MASYEFSWDLVTKGPWAHMHVDMWWHVVTKKSRVQYLCYGLTTTRVARTQMDVQIRIIHIRYNPTYP